jgi:hypothetical protein
MAKVSSSVDLAVAADKVWKLIGGFAVDFQRRQDKAPAVWCHALAWQRVPSQSEFY